MLRELKDEVVGLQTEMYNLSLTSSTGDVLSVFLKDIRDDPGNYTPVSLTSAKGLQ